MKTNMRITDPNNLPNPVPAKPAETTVQPATQQDSGRGSINVGNDRADLSGVAGRLSEILQTESTQRAERIRQLKEAVAAGTYEVNPADLSRAMVNEALQTGGTDKIGGK